MTRIGASRRLLIGLAVSLSLNLFFIGGIASRAYLMRSEGASSDRPLPPSLGWIIADLEPARQEALREKIRGRTMEGRAARIRMLKAQRESNRLMSATPYDAAALSAAFEELRAAAADYQRLSHTQTAQALGELTAEERGAALSFLQRRGPREGRPPREGREHREPPAR
jgi:uncharacterized membrane protein